MSESVHIVCPHCGSTNRVDKARLDAGPKCGKCKQPLFPGAPVELGQANFQKVIGRTEVPVVVDFWAPWCGPCKMMAPIFQQAAQQLKTKALFAKVNTENEPMLAGQFGIRGIPTTVIFKGGVEVGRQVGAMDLAGLLAWVQPYLGGGG